MKIMFMPGACRGQKWMLDSPGTGVRMLGTKAVWEHHVLLTIESALQPQILGSLCCDCTCATSLVKATCTLVLHECSSLHVLSFLYYRGSSECLLYTVLLLFFLEGSCSSFTNSVHQITHSFLSFLPL